MNSVHKSQCIIVLPKKKKFFFLTLWLKTFNKVVFAVDNHYYYKGLDEADIVGFEGVVVVVVGIVVALVYQKRLGSLKVVGHRNYN